MPGSTPRRPRGSAAPIDASQGKHEPDQECQLQSAPPVRKKSQQGKKHERRRHISADKTPDAGQNAFRIAVGEDGAKDVGKDELGKRLGRQMEFAKGVSGMVSEIGIPEVVGRRNQQWRR